MIKWVSDHKSEPVWLGLHWYKISKILIIKLIFSVYGIRYTNIRPKKGGIRPSLPNTLLIEFGCNNIANSRVRIQKLLEISFLPKSSQQERVFYNLTLGFPKCRNPLKAWVCMIQEIANFTTCNMLWSLTRPVLTFRLFGRTISPTHLHVRI